ncbi:hypothetical protein YASMINEVIRUS_1069 [Yasminevirus sp. GU-2018]|uniref:Uncharacterized protein n=1 Tax=Yasminevirus sp. GU-2018 TaxID=2420051 RepID=A0A5K0UBS1_9VIRU|nr:hypothetical protein YASMINEVIRUS_1069 [Yasminevirus sp. GU-2018]
MCQRIGIIRHTQFSIFVRRNDLKYVFTTINRPLMNNEDSCDNFVMILTVALIVVVGYTVLIGFMYPSEDECGDNTEQKKTQQKENFGALQSLYSNDGPQDAYLTVENDPDLYYDPYGYWRGVTWNLPTRNINSIAFYPHLYERYIDRYGTLYPYWSL